MNEFVEFAKNGSITGNLWEKGEDNMRIMWVCLKLIFQIL